jgi:hypothetical protein
MDVPVLMLGIDPKELIIMDVSYWAYHDHTLKCFMVFIVPDVFVINMVCGRENVRNSSGNIEVISVK